MRRFFACLLAVFVCALQGHSEPIKVVTWNIQWFPGRTPTASEATRLQHIKAAQEEIKKLDPDVLLLQEIADWKAAAELVSVLPGFQVHVASDFVERPQNLIIASRLPADSAWYDLWKRYAENEPPRGYAFAALKLPDGRFLLAYSLHLKSNRGGVDANIKARQESAQQLVSHLDAMKKLYAKRGPCSVVIGGDFNTSADDSRFAKDNTLAVFRDAGLKWVHEGVPFSQRITIPGDARYPDNCFDHLFYTGLELKSVTVPSPAGISDHRPVLATFE
jgi:endonuclease/exonuclease/phosphatase family metal-dependent hydrolase